LVSVAYWSTAACAAARPASVAAEVAADVAAEAADVAAEVPVSEAVPLLLLEAHAETPKTSAGITRAQTSARLIGSFSLVVDGCSKTSPDLGSPTDDVPSSRSPRNAGVTVDGA
jgi:hypothetical protein